MRSLRMHGYAALAESRHSLLLLLLSLSSFLPTGARVLKVVAADKSRHRLFVPDNATEHQARQIATSRFGPSEGWFGAGAERVYGDAHERCEPLSSCPRGIIDCLNRVSEFMHSRANRRQMLACLHTWHQAILCGEWRFHMSFMTSVYAAHRPLGYAPERFIDFFGRTAAVVALFERCMLPWICHEVGAMTKTSTFFYTWMNHVSQAGQDVWVNDHFERRRDLTFVEVGAADGITYSNTYILEKCFNWRGIAIEPDPGQFAKMRATNRSCHLHQVAVLNSDLREVAFTSIGELSTVSASITPKSFAGRKSAMDELEKDSDVKVHQVQVPVSRLGALLARHNIEEVHYLSIDVEGSEMQVLKSMDLNKVFVHVITVEMNRGRQDQQSPSEYLRAFGYEHVHTIGLLDEIFVRTRR